MKLCMLPQKPIFSPLNLTSVTKKPTNVKALSGGFIRSAEHDSPSGTSRNLKVTTTAVPSKIVLFTGILLLVGRDIIVIARAIQTSPRYADYCSTGHMNSKT
jgi:hypothetical protein